MVNQPGAKISVIILDHTGQETYRYQGRAVERGPGYLILEAAFTREDLPFHGTWLAKGDRWLELYFADRWYNILEIHDRVDDHLKAWYCNICFPPKFNNRSISYKDLALDLLVFPDNRQLVLDEHEFNELPLGSEVKKQAWNALHELQAIFDKKLTGPEKPESLIHLLVRDDCQA